MEYLRQDKTISFDTMGDLYPIESRVNRSKSTPDLYNKQVRFVEPSTFGFAFSTADSGAALHDLFAEQEDVEPFTMRSAPVRRPKVEESGIAEARKTAESGEILVMPPVIVPEIRVSDESERTRTVSDSEPKRTERTLSEAHLATPERVPKSTESARKAKKARNVRFTPPPILVMTDYHIVFEENICSFLNVYFFI